MGDMQKMYKCPDCGYQSLTYSDSAHLCWMPGWIKKQADIISTPEDLQADDAAVSALMMESDITAPIKEQCEENARLMREIAALKAQRNNDAAQYKAIGAELAKITLLEKKFTDDLERVKAQMDALECENCRLLTENAELAEKANKYENACKAMANCLHELEG